MERASRKEILAWSMYDFANSAFTTTITTVVFANYFVKYVVPPDGARILGVTLKAAALWPVALGISLAIAGGLAPVIGAICDYTAAKKRWLTTFWSVGCAATVGLFFVRPGDWALGAVLYIVANVCWESSVSLNSSFLPELAPPERLDRVSSIGWGIGYIGGGLCLVLNLLMLEADWLPKNLRVNYALASVGLWWFVFGLPCIVGVWERGTSRPRPEGHSLLSVGFVQVRQTMRDIRRFPTLAMLAASVLIFSAGVATVLSMSGPFAGTTLGFTEAQLIKCFLMIQVVGGVGALLTALFAGRVPTKAALYAMLVVWVGCLVWACFMSRQIEFWIMGVLIGLVMGGTQALSRGLQAQLTPPSATAEFFGLYGVTQKLGAAGAYFAFGVASNAWNLRAGIVVLIVLFLVGFALLRPVDVARGRREAIEEEERRRAKSVENPEPDAL